MSAVANTQGAVPAATRVGRRRLARKVAWHTATRTHRTRIPRAARAWVLAEGSLTARVRAVCPGTFRLRVLRQRRSLMRHDEARALGRDRSRPVLLREVALCCGDTPMVVARTVIPLETLRGQRRRLARLGTRPLGALLFADRSARRGPFAVARLSLPQAGIRGVARDAGPVWGRRAIFRLGGAPLLVSEFFLPTLVDSGM